MKRTHSSDSIAEHKKAKVRDESAASTAADVVETAGNRDETVNATESVDSGDPTKTAKTEATRSSLADPQAVHRPGARDADHTKSDDCADAADEKLGTTDDKSVSVEDKSISVEDKSVSADDKSISVDEKSTAIEDSVPDRSSSVENPEIEGPSEHDNEKDVDQRNATQEKDTEAAASETSKETKHSGSPTQTKSLSGFSTFSNGFAGFGSFGSQSKFQTPSNNANPWAESSEKSPENAKKTDSEDEADNCRSSTPVEDSDLYARVTLQKQDVKTGEEHETCLHQVRVRLYAVNLESKDKAWKERGTGVLKLNETKVSETKDGEKPKYRLVLRTDNVLRVSLNLLLVPKMQVSKGFKSSLHTEKFIRLAGIEDGKAHQFAMKCATESARDELFDAINNVLN